MSTAAPVNRILPVSTVDGPGARSVLFLQGCNLRCLYCHNPETWSLCNACGCCAGVCPANALRAERGAMLWARESCLGCDACLASCNKNASPKVTWMTPEQTMEVVLKGIPFIRGITVSGGECMLYPAYLTGLFHLAKQKKLHCLIDSNATVDFSAYPELMEVCDGVLLDAKAWDTERYRALTQGDGNAILKKNLAFLSAHNRLAEVRVVVVPELVDAEDILQGIARLLGNASSNIPFKLIAFRNNGVRGALAHAPSPSSAHMEALAAQARSLGFQRVSVVA